MTRRSAAWRRRVALVGWPRPVVKIHGQQRSGTNFVHRLMKANAPGVIAPWPDEGGWKHGPYEPHRRWKYLVVVRHPLAWVESLWDWEVKHGRSAAPTLAAYLQQPTIDPRLACVWGADDPWQVFVDSYTTWLDSPLTSAVVRYEDLIEDLDATLGRALRDLGIPHAAAMSDVVDRADVWRTEVVRRPLSRHHALHGWREALPNTDLEAVRRRLPTQLIRRLGYSL